MCQLVTKYECERSENKSETIGVHFKLLISKAYIIYVVGKICKISLQFTTLSTNPRRNTTAALKKLAAR